MHSTISEKISCRKNRGCATCESHIYYFFIFRESCLLAISIKQYLNIWVWIFFPTINISLTAFVSRKNADQKYLSCLNFINKELFIFFLRDVYANPSGRVSEM